MMLLYNCRLYLFYHHLPMVTTIMNRWFNEPSKNPTQVSTCQWHQEPGGQQNLTECLFMGQFYTSIYTYNHAVKQPQNTLKDNFKVTCYKADIIYVKPLRFSNSTKSIQTYKQATSLVLVLVILWDQKFTQHHSMQF